MTKELPKITFGVTAHKGCYFVLLVPVLDGLSRARQEQFHGSGGGIAEFQDRMTALKFATSLLNAVETPFVDQLQANQYRLSQTWHDRDSIDFDCVARDGQFAVRCLGCSRIWVLACVNSKSVAEAYVRGFSSVLRVRFE